MMKQIIITAILAFIILTYGCTEQQSEPVKSQENNIFESVENSYSNEVYKYSFTFPDGFIVVDSTNIGALAQSDNFTRPIREMLSRIEKVGWKEGNLLLIKKDNIDNIIFDISGYPSSNDRFSAKKTRENAEKYNIETEESEILVGKDKIIGVQFVTPLKTQSGVAYNAIFQHEENYFTFSFTAPLDENGNRYIGYYNNILGSIQFN